MSLLQKLDLYHLENRHFDFIDIYEGDLEVNGNFECAVNMLSSIETSLNLSVSSQESMSLDQTRNMDGLVIRSFDTFKNIVDQFVKSKHDCLGRKSSIKSPWVSVMLNVLFDGSDCSNANGTSHAIAYLLRDTVLQTWPCILPDQPWIFLVGMDSDIDGNLRVTLHEVQLFSQSSVEVASLDFNNHKLSLGPSVRERRANFQGQEMAAHVDLSPYLFDVTSSGQLTGFHGDVLAILAEKHNFTLNISISAAYCIKLDNGSYGGTIGSLITNDIDFGKH